MVAKVISGKNIRGVLRYNETKVNKHLAECIHASGFGATASNLTFSNKLFRFEKLLSLNPKVRTNTLHISLNFHASEQLNRERLIQISSEYMTRIGFGVQPFLIYKHVDAAHPHVHIVTTNITPTGKRIDIHNIGRNQSEKARKEIEILFDLVKASSRKQGDEQKIIPADILKAIYGKSETKRTISNIVTSVTKTYRYTSLPELNAILRQYNVRADRGTEDSSMFKNNGLIYSIINEQGDNVGIPIKASAIYDKPTLKNLEQKFKTNGLIRQPFKSVLKKIISAELERPNTISSFRQNLNRQGIHVMIRENNDAVIYGLTYIDNKNKVVFNGSDLGKAFTAKGILTKLTFKSPNTMPEESQSHQQYAHPDIIQELLHAEQLDFPNPLNKKRKRKKRKPK